MKKLFFSLYFFLLFALVGKTQSTHLPASYQSAEALTALYQLDDEQRERLLVIIDNRNANLKAIEGLLQTDERTFWDKRKSIYLGQRNSIERMLSTKEQHRVFAAQKTADRRAESDLIKTFLAAGHNREEARLLVLRARY